MANYSYLQHGDYVDSKSRIDLLVSYMGASGASFSTAQIGYMNDGFDNFKNKTIEDNFKALVEADGYTVDQVKDIESASSIYTKRAKMKFDVVFSTFINSMKNSREYDYIDSFLKQHHVSSISNYVVSPGVAATDYDSKLQEEFTVTLDGNKAALAKIIDDNKEVIDSIIELMRADSYLAVDSKLYLADGTVNARHINLDVMTK